MAQPPPGPPPGPGTISPDGRYIWNGNEWVANVPAGLSTVAKKGHKARNFGIGCLGLIVLLLIIAFVSAGGKNTNNTAVSSGGGGGQTGSCSPKPCANADSFTV